MIVYPVDMLYDQWPFCLVVMATLNLKKNTEVVWLLLYPRHMKYASMLHMLKGYIVFVCSVSPFVCPSVHLSVGLGVCPSVKPFYNQVLLRSFFITYNSAATDQKLFIFGMGVPGRVLFHSTSMDPWIMPQGRARGQNLGHSNKVVHCSLFIYWTKKETFAK